MNSIIPALQYCFVFRVDGLLAIVVTDRDGVPLLKGLLPFYLFSDL